MSRVTNTDIDVNAEPTSTPTATSTPVVIPPGGRFRDTQPGEVSVASLNILAPSYHFIGNPDFESAIHDDRLNRVVKAVRMAKETNADILCLQEVEGGPVHEQRLKAMLEEEHLNGIRGYDSYVWSALHPNRSGDVVGNCVAWRSRDHSMISSDCFRRGMVVQIEQTATGATFCVGNVHLPARPADIQGRLKSLSTTIKSIEGCERPRKSNPLDGAVFIAGDFNCNHASVAAELLKRGTAPHGTVRDRNYKAKISKQQAHIMGHNYRFRDIYDGELRQVAAPVTVSLKGRAPGCMDQIFYASGQSASSFGSKASAMRTDPSMSKRKARREMAKQRIAVSEEATVPSALRVHSVIATVDPTDTERMQIIQDGLPNESHGFPTDHIPIGAIFVPEETQLPEALAQLPSSTEFTTHDGARGNVKHSNLSANTRRRRETYLKSLNVRRRHNAILRATTEWLVERGATDIIRDQPLYKWKWAKGVKGLTKKMRAPDLCCVLGKNLVVVEVTVASKPEVMRREKQRKYKDLIELLKEAPVPRMAELLVFGTFVILMDDAGCVPKETADSIEELCRLSGPLDSAASDSKRFCSQLELTFAESGRK